MKKKVVTAMLIMCMAVSATACGEAGTKETQDTKTEAAQDTKDKND